MAPAHRKPRQRTLKGMRPTAKARKDIALAISGATGRAGKILSAAHRDPKFAKKYSAEVAHAEKFMTAVEMKHSLTGEKAKRFLQAAKKAVVPGSSSEKKKPRS